MAYNHPDEQAIVIMDKCSDSIEKMLNRTHTLQVERRLFLERDQKYY